MRKHGGPPSRHDKYVTLAAISPPGVARGRCVGGHQSGLAGCKSPPLFKRGASSCSSQGRRQGEPWGASPRPSAPTYLPTFTKFNFDLFLNFYNIPGRSQGSSQPVSQIPPPLPCSHPNSPALCLSLCFLLFVFASRRIQVSNARGRGPRGRISAQSFPEVRILIL